MLVEYLLPVTCLLCMLSWLQSPSEHATSELAGELVRLDVCELNSDESEFASEQQRCDTLSVE